MPSGSQNGIPGDSGPQAEQPQLGPEAAVVARAGLLEQALVLLQVGLREERRPVDPAQHLPGLVAAPVGARDRGQLERLDPLGRRPVRAEAEVGERAVAVERDGLDPLVADQVLDQLDLVRLVLGRGTARAPRRPGGRSARTPRRRRRAAAIASSICRQVVLGGAKAVRELEVVVEARVDRGADRDLRLRPEVEDRGREDVRAVVADQRQRVRVLVGHDRDLGAVGQLGGRGRAARRRPGSPAPPWPGPARSPPRRRRRSRSCSSSSGVPSGSLTVIRAIGA